MAWHLSGAWDDFQINPVNLATIMRDIENAVIERENLYNGTSTSLKTASSFNGYRLDGRGSSSVGVWAYNMRNRIAAMIPTTLPAMLSGTGFTIIGKPVWLCPDDFEKALSSGSTTGSRVSIFDYTSFTSFVDASPILANLDPAHDARTDARSPGLGRALTCLRECLEAMTHLLYPIKFGTLGTANRVAYIYQEEFPTSSDHETLWDDAVNGTTVIADTTVTTSAAGGYDPRVEFSVDPFGEATAQLLLLYFWSDEGTSPNYNYAGCFQQTSVGLNSSHIQGTPVLFRLGYSILTEVDSPGTVVGTHTVEVGDTLITVGDSGPVFTADQTEDISISAIAPTYSSKPADLPVSSSFGNYSPFTYAISMCVANTFDSYLAGYGAVVCDISGEVTN